MTMNSWRENLVSEAWLGIGGGMDKYALCLIKRNELSMYSA